MRSRMTCCRNTALIIARRARIVLPREFTKGMKMEMHALENFLGSEEVLRQMAEITVKGLKVFEDSDKFFAWMKHPNSALNNKTPISLLISERHGAAMVLDELGRIEHGVFS